MEVSFDVDVKCDNCGESLEARFREVTMTVYPCERCLRDKCEEWLNEKREGRAAEVAELNAEIAKLEEEIEDLIDRANQ